MKPYLLGLALSAALIAASPAYAENKTVEEAIRNRDDLSTFYNVLAINGVFDQLKDDQDYTIFAPTNQAFRKLSIKLYPCFYAGTCKAQASAILLNHFVEGSYTAEDITHEKSELDTVNPGRQLHMNKPTDDRYTVDGNTILYQSSYFSGKIFKIDGVVADSDEVTGLAHPVIVANAEQPAPPPAPQKDAENNPCELDDCSDRAVVAEQPAAMQADAMATPPAPPAATMTEAPQAPVLPWMRPPVEAREVPVQPSPVAPAVNMMQAPAAPIPGEESSLYILRLPGPKVAEAPPSPPVAAPYVDVASNDLPAPAAHIVATHVTASSAHSGVGPVGGKVHLTRQQSEDLARSVFEPDESAPASQATPVFTQASYTQAVPTHFAAAAPTHIASIAPSPHAPYSAANFRSPAAD